MDDLRDTGSSLPPSCVARVVGVERTGLSIAPQGNLPSDRVLSGRWFRGDEETRPTIGDWVIVDSQSGTLLDMLVRRSVIKRVNPLGALQLIAANVDTAFIVTSATRTSVRSVWNVICRWCWKRILRLSWC